MTIITPNLRVLTSLDRCDACQAQAYVVTEIHEVELLWCGHCYTKHEDALSTQGASVTLDSRELLHQSLVSA